MLALCFNIYTVLSYFNLVTPAIADMICIIKPGVKREEMLQNSSSKYTPNLI